MASNTRKTTAKRVRKERTQGRKRKKSLEKKGSSRTATELFGSPSAG